MKQYVGEGYTIYKHTNKVNGKSYIGQTKQTDLTRRWTGGNGYAQTPYFSRAIKKYGWNSFTHEILETGIRTQEEANKKERFYIALYRSNISEYGYNVQSGGQYTGELSEDGRQRLHDRFYGENSPRAKAIDVYDMDGCLVQTFLTEKDAAKYLGCGIGYISGKCKRRTGTVKGHMVHFNDFTHGIKKLPKEMIFARNDQSKHRKIVSQYDLNGKYITSFESVKSAALETGVKRAEISSCINNQKRISAGGFLWKQTDKKDDIQPSKFAGKKEDEHLYAKPVRRIDIETKTIVEYKSRKEAAKANNTTSTTIIRWLKRETPIRGYFWEIIENTG